MRREEKPRYPRVEKMMLQRRVFKSMEEFPIVTVERPEVKTSKGGEERPLMKEREKDPHTKRTQETDSNTLGLQIYAGE